MMMIATTRTNLSLNLNPKSKSLATSNIQASLMDHSLMAYNSS